MRHGRDHRQFGRNTAHRRAMFRNMANAVILQEQIVTTVQKAKEARRVVDRLITLGKGGDQSQRRLAFDRTRDKAVVEKLFDELAKRYKGRPGGYTRVLKMAERRRGDAAEMAVLELVDHPELNRKRAARPAAASGEQAEGATVPADGAADPFNRFRKLFGGTRKGVKAGARKAGGAAETAEKKTAKKKADAAEAKEAKAKSSDDQAASAGAKKKTAKKKTTKKAAKKS